MDVRIKGEPVKLSAHEVEELYKLLTTGDGSDDARRALDLIESSIRKAMFKHTEDMIKYAIDQYKP